MEDAHVAVLLEEIRGQFKVFGESLQAMNDKIDRVSLDMQAALLGVETRLDSRLSNVEGRLTHVEGRLTNMVLALNGSAPRKKTKK